MISLGVPAGATSPYQVVASNPAARARRWWRRPATAGCAWRSRPRSRAAARRARGWPPRRRRKHDLDVAADHVLQRRPRLLVGDMDEVRLGLGLEQFAGKMRGAAVAGRREGDEARLRPGELDQLRQRLRRQGGVHHQGVGLRSEQRDRRKVQLRIESEVLLAGAGWSRECRCCPSAAYSRRRRRARPARRRCCRRRRDDSRSRSAAAAPAPSSGPGCGRSRRSGRPAGGRRSA